MSHPMTKYIWQVKIGLTSLSLDPHPFALGHQSLWKLHPLQAPVTKDGHRPGRNDPCSVAQVQVGRACLVVAPRDTRGAVRTSLDGLPMASCRWCLVLLCFANDASGWQVLSHVCSSSKTCHIECHCRSRPTVAEQPSCRPSRPSRPVAA